MKKCKWTETTESIFCGPNVIKLEISNRKVLLVLLHMHIVICHWLPLVVEVPKAVFLEVCGRYWSSTSLVLAPTIFFEYPSYTYQLRTSTAVLPLAYG